MISKRRIYEVVIEGMLHHRGVLVKGSESTRTLVGAVSRRSYFRIENLGHNCIWFSYKPNKYEPWKFRYRYAMLKYNKTEVIEENYNEMPKYNREKTLCYSTEQTAEPSSN